MYLYWHLAGAKEDNKLKTHIDREWKSEKSLNVQHAFMQHLQDPYTYYHKNLPTVLDIKTIPLFYFIKQRLTLFYS